MEETVYVVISFCEYVYGVSPYQKFGMIEVGRGVRDFADLTKLDNAEIYIPAGYIGLDVNGVERVAGAGLSLDYTYNESAGAFSAVTATTGTHAKAYSPLFIQTGGMPYDAYVETNNIQYFSEKMDGSMLSAFLKVAIGIGRYLWRFVADSNYRFSDTTVEWNMGELNESAAFTADTLRYNGNRKYKVNNHQVQVTHGNCVRFRIDAVPSDGDWRVFDIDLRGGLISETTEVADA